MMFLYVHELGPIWRWIRVSFVSRATQQDMAEVELEVRGPHTKETQDADYGQTSKANSNSDDIVEVREHPARFPPSPFTLFWSGETRWRLLAAVAIVSVLALATGLAAGLSGKHSGWQQPDAPPNAFTFERFTSCLALQTAFNAKVLTGACACFL